MTLAVDWEGQQRFDAERARWSAAGGSALVVLFHELPDDLEERARVDLVDVAGAPFPVGVAAVLPTRTGVAHGLVSPELSARHQELQQRWWQRLTARDRRRLRAHVIVVSGVEPAAARAAHTVLRRAFRPYQITAEGFVLWRVREPWTELARIPFS